MPAGKYLHHKNQGFQKGNDFGIRIKKGGKLGVLSKGVPKPNAQNEQHHNWKGDNVSYVGLHQWVSRWKGKPSVCEKCKSLDKKKYEWVNIDHKYRRVLEDYIRMCTQCHRNYDFEYNYEKNKNENK